ncbi:Ecp2 effector protein domain-containing protein [Madurella fahalii]|uniref:Ecp2 effector protein domain-containing protein n=1 Tax=Madurella fahalii TaxID=1157608 RepID=A0ABQ0GKW0_9PEZI
MIWKHFLPAGLSILLATPCALGDASDEFVGQGQILVLNSSNIGAATPDDRIGCLNKHGMLTLSDCATFTRSDQIPQLSTSEGGCSFQNPDMPTNKDSIYGRNTHAWSCGDYPAPDGTPVAETYYSLNGLEYPFICHGNLACYFDIVANPPPSNSKPAPVWGYYWGSQQMSAPPGHLQVSWLWVRV